MPQSDPVQGPDLDPAKIAQERSGLPEREEKKGATKERAAKKRQSPLPAGGGGRAVCLRIHHGVQLGLCCEM